METAASAIARRNSIAAAPAAKPAFKRLPTDPDTLAAHLRVLSPEGLRAAKDKAAQARVKAEAAMAEAMLLEQDAAAIDAAVSAEVRRRREELASLDNLI